jgi:nitroimidazol reductase NimA-like FMN-containing flavoprotein (pyridoxamine 5'-phosphate oxidase superfamily)
MASPTDHAGQEVMSPQECNDKLAATPVGRVAFIADGDVTILPVNYRYHDSAIVFRTATGSKLEAATRHAPVAFEIDGWDADTKTGWSVLVKGTAVDVLSDDEADWELGVELRPWSEEVERRWWVRIRPDEISGRKIV